jgi:hypothetical protein
MMPKQSPIPFPPVPDGSTATTTRRMPTGALSWGTLPSIVPARLHEDHLPQWRAADAALEAVKRAFSDDFGYCANLVRVSTVNTLYGTNLKATHRMARHIEGVLGAGGLDQDPAALIDAIANLWTGDSGGGPKHRSFASKFCHFFIDGDRFPIFDKAARDALRLHLGPEAIRGCETSYPAFVGALAQLRGAHSVDASPRDLDRYLWIAGMYLEYAKGRRDINRDLLVLFERQPRPAELAWIAQGLGG